MLYHLGSGGGKRQYKNPHTRGVVVASMSSVMPSAQAGGAAAPGAGGAPITAPPSHTTSLHLLTLKRCTLRALPPLAALTALAALAAFLAF